MNVPVILRNQFVPKAYSYIRFSSVKQELGDSVRRQEKLALDYAREHNLELDTRTYRDLGVSAFKGKNATEGRLRTFIDAIESGKIPSGSFLLVESLDRLSREDVSEALPFLLSIIRCGISVVTLTDKRTYSKATIREDGGMSLMVSILYMGRAHDESAIKSSRVRAAWTAKHASGKILTAMCPAWLHPTEDRTNWVLNEDKVRVVQQIFELSLAGHGAPSIARVLNTQKTPTMQRAEHWGFGTVAAILKNQAVIGRYVPKKSGNAPIDNYFPKIISESDFRLVSHGMKARQWIGGRNSEAVTNLFAGMSFCFHCGTAMRVVGSNNRHTYLKCLSAYSKDGCHHGRFPYLAAEKAILYRLSVDLAEIMATTESNQSELPRLLIKKDDLDSRIKKLGEALEVAENPKALTLRLNSLHAELATIQRDISTTLEPTDFQIDKPLMNEYMGYFDGDEIIPIQMRKNIQTFLRKIIKTVCFWYGNDINSPTISIEFQNQIKFSPLFIDITPFKEKIGGNRKTISAK
jgi:DNA invertase Pin-like site-specific DNA recombinase